MNAGLNEATMCLYADSANNLLYAGGYFWQDTLTGKSLRHVTVWDGNEWNELGIGSGLMPGDGPVENIIKYKNNIYVAGVYFWDAIGLKFHSFAKWDGSNWYNVGEAFAHNNFGGVDIGIISNLKVFSDTLYLSGSFDSIGTVKSHMIAKFDGENWYDFPALDSVPGWAISCFEEYKGDLYVAGNFYGGDSLADIAKFENGKWKPWGKGLSGPGTHVQCMAKYKGLLYIGGWFYKPEDPGNAIAAWDGENWVDIPIDIQGQIMEMKVLNDTLYLAGGTYFLNGEWVDGWLMKYDGQNFTPVISSLTPGGCMAIEKYNGNIVIGGGFGEVNGVQGFSNIAMAPLPNYVSSVEDKSESIFKSQQLFPNPFREKINLPHGFNSSVTIQDTKGQIVYSGDVSSLDNKISSGVYFLKATDSEGKTQVFKLVKE